MRNICSYLVKSLSKTKPRHFPRTQRNNQPTQNRNPFSQWLTAIFLKELLVFTIFLFSIHFSMQTDSVPHQFIQTVYEKGTDDFCWLNSVNNLVSAFSLHLLNKYLLTIICQVLPSKIERQISIKSYHCRRNKCN